MGAGLDRQLTVVCGPRSCISASPTGKKETNLKAFDFVPGAHASVHDLRVGLEDTENGQKEGSFDEGVVELVHHHQNRTGLPHESLY